MSPSPLSWLRVAGVPIFGLALVYITYQRWFHPLSKYPGPFLASLTDLWKAYQMTQRRLPYKYAELHEKYGPVIRVGPNSLSFSDPNAIAPIYQAGRRMKKSKFYDGFTAFIPNMFGTQNETFHAVRRRQVSDAFSMNSVKKMEPLLNQNISFLRLKLDSASKACSAICLKDCFAYYMVDVLGELAFSQSFGVQMSDNPNPPRTIEHILLSNIMGLVPNLMPFLKKITPWVPIPWVQNCVATRIALKKIAVDCVGKRLEKSQPDRTDILSYLVNARDPETGAKLSEDEINTEAFGLIIAGTHSTAASLGVLFWYLLHNPENLEKCVEEINEKLGSMDENEAAYPMNHLETLDYLMVCIKESFRMHAIFNMTLNRLVISPEGAAIAGHHIPYGTEVAVINHCAHHNIEAWGPDHDIFDPSRWFDSRGSGKESWVIPFSVGHRACLGKNMAMTNILKVTTTLLSNYTFEVVDKDLVNPDFESVGVAQMKSSILCYVEKRE